ncbi:hypothetical protein MHA_2392 [Mannheimia haemolytica PHL213]|nr:hypothetical protein MHA_2392 [Mannheimia haemolytica PHL213]
MIWWGNPTFFMLLKHNTMIQINSISYSVEQNRKLLSNISLNLSKGRLYGA